MKLKTAPSFAIESAIQQDNYDLKLLGTENVSRIDKNFKPNNNTFYATYGLDCKFFYFAQLYSNKIPTTYEVGLGYLYSNDNSYFLKRQTPLYFSSNSNTPSPVIGSPRPLICSSENDILIVSTYIPRSYLELLTDGNCLVSTVAPYVPSLTYVEKDCFVGRLDDNIESLPIKSLSKYSSFNSAVVDSISKTTKSLILKSKYITLSPSEKRPPAVDGTLYFDKNYDTLCYYAGGCWREIVWKRCLDENTP